MAELADRVRGEAGGGEAGVLGVEVADGEGDVAVAVAEGIGAVRPLLTVSSTSKSASGLLSRRG